MKNSFGSLRLVLALVFLVTLFAAYIFLFLPELMLRFYPDVIVLDTMHLHCAMAMGAIMVVLATGTLLAFLRPVKNAGAVTFIILFHFAIFIVDIVLLAQGANLALRFLIPEIVYMLAVCTLLIRFFPSESKIHEVVQTADMLVNAFDDKLKKREKEEKAARKQEEKEKKTLEKELKKAQRQAEKQE